ncbi:PglL family O-oligosaccharyltransferase [Halomonas alkalicola]|uniref:PglL family O-oligosaccharyltransferase n=1 Tax=Halomonas alkalicola TaxID=1930622 RepID=UPI00266050FA|nr:Wzy polymerase domain-containing protein [Halomonas alkalicola]
MDASTPSDRRLISAFIGAAFFTFVVLLHFTFPNMGGTGLRMPHNAAVWMGFALMMALAMWPAARGVIRFSAFHKGLGLLLLALWLPFLWSWNEASLIALPRLLTVTAGAILLLGLAQLPLTRRDWWWIGMAILTGALLETAYGYVQFYLLQPGNWLGYRPDYGRPWGIFQQVNVMASFLATGLVISAWLYGEARNRIEKGIILLAPVFMPAMLWVIASRSGWLGATIGVALVLVHLWRLERTRFKQWASALMAGVMLAVVVSLTAGEGGRSAEAITSQGLRPQVYEHSLRMIAEKPVAGWGYGRFQHDFLHSHADWRTAEEGRTPLRENYAHPHNELLYWGIEGGLLPVLALLAFALWVGWRVIARGPSGEKWLLLALLVPLSVHTMLELPFYHSLAHWVVMLLMIGLVSQRCWATKERGNRYTFGIRVGAWLAVPVLWVFMGTHMQALGKIGEYIQSNGEKAAALTEIKNPFGVENEINALLMNQRLTIAYHLHWKEPAEDYIKWAVEQSEKRPSLELYKDMKKAYRVIGKEKYNKFMAKAKRIYPNEWKQKNEQP